MNLVNETARVLDDKKPGESQLLADILKPIISEAKTKDLVATLKLAKKAGIFTGDSDAGLIISEILAAEAVLRDIKIDEILTDEIANSTGGVEMPPTLMSNKPIKRFTVPDDIYENVDFLKFSSDHTHIIEELNKGMTVTIAKKNGESKTIRKFR